MPITFVTGDMFGKSEIPETKFQIFLHGTNKTLTCKGNELTFEEGEQNDDNTWTVETARDKSTGHYSPILKSLSGKYITGKERDNGPAGLGTIEEAADIEVGFPFPYPEKEQGANMRDSDVYEPYQGTNLIHDSRYLGIENGKLYWGDEGFKLDFFIK